MKNKNEEKLIDESIEESASQPELSDDSNISKEHKLTVQTSHQALAPT